MDTFMAVNGFQTTNKKSLPLCAGRDWASLLFPAASPITSEPVYFRKAFHAEGPLCWGSHIPGREPGQATPGA